MTVVTQSTGGSPQIFSHDAAPRSDATEVDHPGAGTTLKQLIEPSINEVAKGWNALHRLIQQSQGNILSATGSARHDVIPQVVKELISGRPEQVKLALSRLATLASNSAMQRAQRAKAAEIAAVTRKASTVAPADLSSEKVGEPAEIISEKIAEPAEIISEKIAEPAETKSEVSEQPNGGAADNVTLQDILRSPADSAKLFATRFFEAARSVSQKIQEVRLGGAADQEPAIDTRNPVEGRAAKDVTDLAEKHAELWAKVVVSANLEQDVSESLVDKSGELNFLNLGGYVMGPKKGILIEQEPGKPSDPYTEMIRAEHVQATKEVVTRRLTAWGEQQVEQFVGHVLKEDDPETRQKIIGHLADLSTTLSMLRPAGLGM